MSEWVDVRLTYALAGHIGVVGGRFEDYVYEEPWCTDERSESAKAFDYRGMVSLWLLAPSETDLNFSEWI